MEKQYFLAFRLFYHEIASRCDFGVNLVSFSLIKTTKIASWRRLGTSWARLGRVFGRLGRSWAVLGVFGGVLEASGGVLGLSWVPLGSAWARLGASGAQRTTAARVRRGR